jgi:hypothetical protein
MRALIAVAALVASVTASAACTYPWQTASDGSRCGDRASTIRPGGR